MADYTIKVRRFQPESGEGPYWEEFNVDLDPDRIARYLKHPSREPEYRGGRSHRDFLIGLGDIAPRIERAEPRGPAAVHRRTQQHRHELRNLRAHARHGDG